MNGYFVEIILIVLALAAAIIAAVASFASKSEAVRMRREQAAAAERAMTADKAELERLLMESRYETVEGTGQRVASLREEMQAGNGAIRETISVNEAEARKEMAAQITALRTELGTRLSEQATQSEQKLENIRTTMETRIRAMQDDNAKQLDQMRATVDEKLQKTLNERITQSFQLVTEQLDLVSKGLGEMQTLASGVGDLKKVLSNVKNRGILGEYQLGAILAEILSPEQYEENIPTIKGSAERVEFAIRLPGDGTETIYLPIDAKFPADAYSRLVDAYEAGDTAEIDAAGKQLDSMIKQSGKAIHDKYVQPPETTDFAIMFLPFEGLYAEVVRRGMVEELQRLYKVNIAGPTTMAALLNSLQMGFKTLAIQKRSSEVWGVLAGVKSEFENFENVLKKAQQRIEQTNDELEKLVGVRTRAINRKLKGVASLEAPDAEGETIQEVLSLAAGDEDEDA
ncbi:MAG: DNA recombination protein RmuC [Clostridiales Family XIII bacterium]|jgi:DNA recombination protein RmuC|nr:DNA recombination protein RmuC [Clostridiales Family XIII bacterium]